MSNEYENSVISRFIKISSNKDTNMNGVTVEDLLSTIRLIANSDLFIKLDNLVKELVEHVTNTNNPHEVHSDQLTETVLDTIYEKWVFYGNTPDVEKLKHGLFEWFELSLPGDLRNIFDIEDPLHDTGHGIISEIVITLGDLHLLLDSHLYNMLAHEARLNSFFNTSKAMVSEPIIFTNKYIEIPSQYLPVYNPNYSVSNINLKNVIGSVYGVDIDSPILASLSFDYRLLKLHMINHPETPSGVPKTNILFQINSDTNIGHVLRVAVIYKNNEHVLELNYSNVNKVTPLEYTELFNYEIPIERTDKMSLEEYTIDKIERIGLVLRTDHDGLLYLDVKLKDIRGNYTGIITTTSNTVKIPCVFRNTSIHIPTTQNSDSYVDDFKFYIDSSDQTNSKYLLDITV